MISMIEKLKGPILVLGGRGFIGSNLLRYLRNEREDVIGGVSRAHDLAALSRCPTVFNCIGYGADKYQTSSSEMFSVNFNLVRQILSELEATKGVTYIHAGSSSEYGGATTAVLESAALNPVTPYGISKASASMLVNYWGKVSGYRTANLRLYNVYGDGDHENTLMSSLVREGKKGVLINFRNEATCRDFVHVEDVCRAFVFAAVNLKESQYGESFNIGGDVRTLAEVAKYARRVFRIEAEPVFDNAAPLERWCAHARKAEKDLGFKSEISLICGMKKLAKSS